jgi:MFS transporter, ACS family, hexuronate transporter
MQPNDPRRRYHIFLFIMAMALLNYIDRGAMSYGAASITAEYGLNRAQWGALLGYFGYGYLFGALCGGFLADGMGPRRVWVRAAGCWSILAMATAFAGDFGVAVLGGSALAGFATVRILFGFAEGPAYSAINKSISNWAAPKERGFVISLGLVSTPLGALLTAPIASGLQYVTGGWRAMFIVLGVVSLVVLALLMRVFTDKPQDNRYISEEEKRYLAREQAQEFATGQYADATVQGAKIPWWWFFRSRTLVLNALAYFSFMYVTFLLLTWTPKYLEDQFHYSLSSLWYMGMIPWVGACFTVLLGGRLSDYIFKRTGSLIKARSLFAAGCLLLTSICFYFVSQAQSVWMAVGLLTLANAINSLPNSVFWAVVIDSVPRSRTGTFSGITHAIANTAAIIAPTLTGYLTMKYGYSAMFTAATVATGVGVLAMLFVRPGDRLKVKPDSAALTIHAKI